MQTFSFPILVPKTNLIYGIFQANMHSYTFYLKEPKDYWVELVIVRNLANICAAANSLASRRLERMSPPLEHSKSTPLTVTPALNPPSEQNRVKITFILHGNVYTL